MIQERKSVVALFFSLGAVLFFFNSDAIAQLTDQQIINKKENPEQSESGHTYKFRIQPNSQDKVKSSDNADINTDSPEGKLEVKNLKNPTKNQESQ